MLQLKNATPFAAKLALFPNEEGVDCAFMIVKATFNIGPQWTLAREQFLPVEEDVYWAEPGYSSIKYASDYHTGKVATDVIVLGNAYAPQGQTVTELDVCVSVGEVSKKIKVYGDRVWQDGQASQAKAFNTMPLTYEKAFGGSYIVDQSVQATCESNPLGSGFSGGRSVNEMNGVALPNLEDPENLIRKHSDQPAPACMAYVAASWQPRVAYAGTYDQNWQAKRAPFLPEDFNKRFFNMAHEDLIYPGFIKGGEAVKISNMHPAGELNFTLPSLKLVANVKLSDRIECPDFQMETLLLEPNLMRLSMVWKAQFVCDKETLNINEIGISLSR